MALTLTSVQAQPNIDLALDEACRRIAPLWPLQSFVAVNPFLGVSDRPFAEAARLLGKVAHSTTLMEGEFYLSRLRDGSISAGNVRAALAQYGSAAGVVDPVDPISWLSEQLQASNHTERLLTVADWLDYVHGTTWPRPLWMRSLNGAPHTLTGDRAHGICRGKI